MSLKSLAAAFSFALLLHDVNAQASDEAVQNATAFALLYGYPLLSYQKVVPSLLETVGVNKLAHGRTFSTAASRNVVKPNVDTLYTSLAFDLSQDDLVLTVPDVPRNQFHLFSYYDVFGNNFANTGTLNHDVPGDYLLRRSSDASSTYGVELAENGTASPKYQAYINSPTTYGFFLIRWLVRNASVYDAIHAYQNATHTTPQPRTNSSQTHPTLLQLEQNAPTAGSPASKVLHLLAAIAPNNRPELLAAAASVSSNLSLAGIHAGTYTPPAASSSSMLNLTLANQTALHLAQAAITSPSNLTPLNNGWSMMTPNKTGNFGPAYALRAAVAFSGYLMLQAPNALYPTWTNSSSSSSSSATASAGTLPLCPRCAYTFTFSRRPPLQPTGFWSLTAYGADNYLIPNPHAVYALGDRSNLTFADGTPVYAGAVSPSPSPSPHDDDAPFTLLVQPADLPPPRNWTANWLPGPAGGGEIELLLRWFGAAPALTDGAYVYPAVRYGAAVTA